MPFDPARDGAEDLRVALREGRGGVRRLVPRLLRAQPGRREPALPDGPARPAGGARAGRRHRHRAAPTPAARASSRDLYHRAIAVEDAADACGGYRSLSEAQAFAVEYWPLERYKLAQAPPRGELAGRIALITGGASGIGRATARLLAERGAHVVVADRNAEGAATLADELERVNGARRALAVEVDVTDEAAVEEMVRRCVLAYGGLDVLVASAGIATSAPITETTRRGVGPQLRGAARGYFLAAREAFRALEAQGRGGSVVFVGSKNALVAGANAAAYSSAKAASLHLARCLAEEGGPHGIRVNTVNPDAVIAGSGIWSSDWKAERARTYGVERGGPAGLLPRPHPARRGRLPRATWPRRSPSWPARAPPNRPATSINVDGGVHRRLSRDERDRSPYLRPGAARTPRRKGLFPP